MYWISQYKVEDEPIGEGGMGRILRGYTPDGKEVAIKEILPEFAADIEMRFRISQEMRFLERLNHEAIVKNYESFMLGDKYYIVMELVDGLNLEQYVEQNGVFSEQEAIAIMVKVLNVMQYVHEQKVVHRDLKPSNIMIRKNGDICLLDFGIAKDMSVQHHTQYVIGSDGYMSPEQASATDIDFRSDIYALACVLFYMLTGNHAFPHKESAAEMMRDIMEKPFPKISKFNKNVSARLQKVIEHAADKNMMKRYQSCKEFADALQGKQQKGPSTNVNPQMRDNRCVVTLGREGCDIIFNDPYQSVSRHHAEIELKSFTGGSFYIYRDDSSNGTLINGQMIHHMAYHIPCEEPLPEVLLAGHPDQRLDWNEVTEMLQQRKAELDAMIKEVEAIPQAQAHDKNEPTAKVDKAAKVDKGEETKSSTTKRTVNILVGILLCILGCAIIIVAHLEFEHDIAIRVICVGLGAGIISIGIQLIRKK